MIDLSEYIDLKVRVEVDNDIVKSGAIPLGEIRAHLLCQPPNAPVVTSDGLGLCHLHSYRGFCRFPAIMPTDEKTTVSEVLYEIDTALGGRVYTEYKGDDFTYNNFSPLFIAPYGNSTDDIVTDVVWKDNKVVIVTGVFGT